jgi:hypothetical protein
VRSRKKIWLRSGGFSQQEWLEMFFVSPLLAFEKQDVKLSRKEIENIILASTSKVEHILDGLIGMGTAQDYEWIQSLAGIIGKLAKVLAENERG